MFKHILPLLLLTTSLFSAEIEMGTAGYMRIQTTADDEKANLCFKTPGASTKYRLGNECETWIELAILQDIRLDNDVVIHNQVRPLFSGANNEKIDFIKFEEVYSEVFNTLDNSVSFWVGRRFYKRYDSYLPDYFFLNMSGDGAGVNNLDLGEVALSYSFIFNEVNPETIAGDKSLFFQSHDVRLKRDTSRGEVTLFLNYMHLEAKEFDSSHKIDASDGFALGVLYKDRDILNELFSMDGENISGVFFGEGLARGAGAYSPYHSPSLIDELLSNQGKSVEKSKTFRLINYNAFEKENVGIMSNIVYEYSDNSDFTGSEQNWLSAGLRPYWFFSRYSRVAFEAGYDYVDDKTYNKSYGLGKLSTALEFAMDRGIWNRPVLRLFYTKAWWNSDTKNRIDIDNYYANESSGDNLGIQLEYWW